NHIVVIATIGQRVEDPDDRRLAGDNLDRDARLRALLDHLVGTWSELDEADAGPVHVDLDVVIRTVTDQVEGEGRRSVHAVLFKEVEGVVIELHEVYERDRAHALAIELDDDDEAGGRFLDRRNERDRKRLHGAVCRDLDGGDVRLEIRTSVDFYEVGPDRNRVVHRDRCGKREIFRREGVAHRE